MKKHWGNLNNKDYSFLYHMLNCLFLQYNYTWNKINREIMRETYAINLILALVGPHTFSATGFLGVYKQDVGFSELYEIHLSKSFK